MKLRIFLVVASLILSILIGFSIARKSGGSQGVAVKTRPLIGFSMDTLKEARWQKDRDIFINTAKSMSAQPSADCIEGYFQVSASNSMLRYIRCGEHSALVG